MTTPERLRRRQRIEGFVLIILTLAMVVQSIYFNSRDNKQNDCIATSFANLTHSSQIRAKLVERDSKLKTSVIKKAFDSKSQEEFSRVKTYFETEQAKIDEERRLHPVPPFTPSKCE